MVAIRKEHIYAAGALYFGTVGCTYVYFKSFKSSPVAVQPTTAQQPNNCFDALAPTYDNVIGSEERVLGYGLIRWWMLSQAKGDVLEISAGTGRNFKHYKYANIKSLTVCDVSKPMLDVAEAKYYDELVINFKHPEHSAMFCISDAHCMCRPEGHEEPSIAAITETPNISHTTGSSSTPAPLSWWQRWMSPSSSTPTPITATTNTTPTGTAAPHTSAKGLTFSSSTGSRSEAVGRTANQTSDDAAAASIPSPNTSSSLSDRRAGAQVNLDTPTPADSMPTSSTAAGLPTNEAESGGDGVPTNEATTEVSVAAWFPYSRLWRGPSTAEREATGLGGALTGTSGMSKRSLGPAAPCSCCGSAPSDRGTPDSAADRCQRGRLLSGDPLQRFPPQSFDTVVDTFGLCSHQDPVQVLREVAKVCRPGGQIILLEHGRSTWDWLNEQLDSSAKQHHDKWGCWWNRDIIDICQQAGLQLDSITRWHFGTTYMIKARPVAAEAGHS